MKIKAEEKKCVNAFDYTGDWDSWLDRLHGGMKTAEKLGMSEERIQKIGKRLADHLSKSICASTPEEQLMKDLWNVASEEERKTMTAVFFKLLDKRGL
ncbi:DUF3243 family protein [Methanonatronarchaeum sp. AMET-Sl]|uniref:DUF3243 family protein n=1 Tax=Methanonatronarchaeum sp. AMET-Sl TaxID=3037654 RepID=UPI00244DAC25|nr:DUF3243 family protein [Methanonatronarchaeum sp. AMET-Sl]WGI17069.1 DUF3243 family protein [Methanonatronarchaeum sp. AMET-Sl]